jgi:hypothetical protein
MADAVFARHANIEYALLSVRQPPEHWRSDANG